MEGESSMAWFAARQENDEPSAEDVIALVHQYYETAQKRFPLHQESFYLCVTWAVHAKKHHPRLYRNQTLSNLLPPALANTAKFSSLPKPISIDALAYFLVQEDGLDPDHHYEHVLKGIMKEVNISKAEEIAQPTNAKRFVLANENLLHWISEKDF